jgi:tetraacyldisaccharide 4'-kinase
MPSSTDSSSTPDGGGRGRLEAWLNGVWYGERRAAWLAPLSLAFRALVSLRRGFYRVGLWRRHAPGVPVIVVGNLTVGGTGKTPLTLWLARRLAAAGLSPGIATRGFRGSRDGVLDVGGDDDPAIVGDEPLLLAQRSGVPVCVGRDRVAVARRLAARGCRVVVCDDGLQHLRLAADLTIVVVDGDRGLGNGRLLPAGPLREPPARLGDIDLVVTRGPLGRPLPLARPLRAPPFTMYLQGGEAASVADPSLRRPLEEFRRGPVHAVAGIGHPERFFAGLRQRGLELRCHAFPDHHPYTVADLAFGDVLPVLMTEKDAVKCRAFADARLWFVPVDAAFDAADEHRLLARLAAVPGLEGVFRA